MCVVSMIGDHYEDKWNKYITNFEFIPPVTRLEFEQLKKEVEEMKVLLKRAKEYDEKNNEPNCEIEEKMKVLKMVAEGMGINLDDYIKKQS